MLKYTIVSTKQLVFGLVIFFIVLTFIVLILLEESQVVYENNNGTIKYSKEVKQSVNDYIITIQTTGLIKNIKNIYDDGKTRCFYFLIDENLWYNSTNYETKKMILNASEIYSYSKNRLINFMLVEKSL